MTDLSTEVRQLYNKMLLDGVEFTCDTFPEVIYTLETDERRIFQIKQELRRPDGVVEYDVWGLVCFSTESVAQCFLRALKHHDLHPRARLFDDARELARKLTDVDCLFLLDDPQNIIVHWVK